MTAVSPLPAPARMSTGPPVVSTASRCCGLSWERKDKVEELQTFYLDFTGRPHPRPVIPSEENRGTCCLHAAWRLPAKAGSSRLKPFGMTILFRKKCARTDSQTIEHGTPRTGPPAAKTATNKPPAHAHRSI